MTKKQALQEFDYYIIVHQSRLAALREPSGECWYLTAGDCWSRLRGEAVLFSERDAVKYKNKLSKVYYADELRTEVL